MDKQQAALTTGAHSSGTAVRQGEGSSFSRKELSLSSFALILLAQKSKCPESSQSPAKWPWGAGDSNLPILLDK